MAVAFVVPPLLEVVSFARLERALAFAARHVTGRAPTDAIAVSWVDNALAGKPQPWRHTCLRRAAVLYYLLRSAKRDVQIAIGVRRDADGELKAHAWLLHDNAMYFESPTMAPVVPTYREIARFPSEAQ